jgi:hypothetical protein
MPRQEAGMMADLRQTQHEISKICRNQTNLGKSTVTGIRVDGRYSLCGMPITDSQPLVAKFGGLADVPSISRALPSRLPDAAFEAAVRQAVDMILARVPAERRGAMFQDLQRELTLCLAEAPTTAQALPGIILRARLAAALAAFRLPDTRI